MHAFMSYNRHDWRFEKYIDYLEKLIDLKAQLQCALQAEDYEQAAKLRDVIEDHQKKIGSATQCKK